MRAPRYITIVIVTTLALLLSFFPTIIEEVGKIFHAAPSQVESALYILRCTKTATYQICNSGGIGQNCYSGKFELQ
jgi:hypothetical protein